MKGADLRELRVRKGWTQARAAEYARVTPNTWARWERDEVPIPGPAIALLEQIPEETLGDTGQVLVSLAAARQYAAGRGLGIEEARRELTELLVGEKRTSSPPASGLEGWRARSRTLQVDVGAQVSREGALAVVTHAHVRGYRPRRRRR